VAIEREDTKREDKTHDVEIRVDNGPTKENEVEEIYSNGNSVEDDHDKQHKEEN